MVVVVEKEGSVGKVLRVGKYEIGRSLGEGSFGKVKYARNVETGQGFAVKILEKQKIVDLKIAEQIKREIGTLKLLKHPNVVRLYEVLASKTKIYMILECVTGGELFDKIASCGRIKESEGRKLFQQLIDAVSYCHEKGVFHRDLKPENVLVDAQGNIKVSDFGLSALPQHFRDDGLLHTTCGSPNYVAPEVLMNRGYNGATSDIWSCGVILYVILTGYLPFDDRNLAVLCQKIFKADFQLPKWLSRGAQNLIRRILDPNPKTRITTAKIKEDEWFKQGYTPANPDEDDEEAPTKIHIDYLDDHLSPRATGEKEGHGNSRMLVNAFELIGMSSSLDLSGFFEKEDASERKMRFTSNYSSKDLLGRIEDIATSMGYQVAKKNGKLKVMENKENKSPCSLLVATEVFELNPSLHVVELSKSRGDLTIYRELCKQLENDLGVCKNPPFLIANGAE